MTSDSISSAPFFQQPTIHSNTSNDLISSIRATKRKFDDAIQNLDDAVRSTDSLTRPSPSKRVNMTPSSLYSTLAKYGIKSKEPKTSSSSLDADLTKKAPHLSKILARTATRTKNAFPFRAPSKSTSNLTSFNPNSEYRPSSIPSFLSRLATFKLSTYANKPAAIDAVAASKCGWVNEGKDRLVCGICDASWILAGRDGMNRDAANALIEKQRVSLIEMHKDGCPWKTRQCDASIYRIPLQTPGTTVKQIKSNAIELESVLFDVEVKHPLTSTQINNLRATLATVTLPTPSIADHLDEPPVTPTTESSRSSPIPPGVQLSDEAILTSLFGWSLAPPAPPPERSRTSSSSRASSMRRTPSQSHANSVAPSTPTISRAQSVALSSPGEEPNSPIRRPALRLGSIPPSAPTPRTPNTSRDTSLLHCALCQRRVGLWAFGPPTPRPSFPTPPPTGEGSLAQLHVPQPVARPKRQFDLLKEHRAYCPYVVKSTILPSLPGPSSSIPNARMSNPSLTQLNNYNAGAVEGWRAVLSVLLRYGASQRQRMSMASRYESRVEEHGTGNRLSSPTKEPQCVGEGNAMDMDGIDAVMAGVKSRGGKDLIKYIKGLLG